MSTLVAGMSRWSLDLCTRCLAIYYILPAYSLVYYPGFAFQDPNTIEHQQRPSGDKTSEKKRNTHLAECGPMYQVYTTGCMFVVYYYISPFRIPVLLKGKRDLMETCMPCPRYQGRKGKKKRTKGGRMMRCSSCLRGRVVLRSLFLARAHWNPGVKGSVIYLFPTEGVKQVIIKILAKNVIWIIHQLRVVSYICEILPAERKIMWYFNYDSTKLHSAADCISLGCTLKSTLHRANNYDNT